MAWRISASSACSVLGNLSFLSSLYWPGKSQLPQLAVAPGTMVFAMLLEPANSWTMAFAMLLEAANSGTMVFAMLLEPANSGTMVFAMILETANSANLSFLSL